MRSSKSFSGFGQIFKAGKYLCKVRYNYTQSGDPSVDIIEITGELLVYEKERRTMEVLNGLAGDAVELCADNGDRMDIVVLGVVGSPIDGRYRWVPVPGNFPVK